LQAVIGAIESTSGEGRPAVVCGDGAAGGGRFAAAGFEYFVLQAAGGGFDALTLFVFAEEVILFIDIFEGILCD
jgi:hypothetical protein